MFAADRRGRNVRQRGFKDYFLILQVHPEADAQMIEAAYWHLAKRYNEAAKLDPTIREQIEDLNEAYAVLGSAEKKEQYLALRARVLGAGSLPVAPPPNKPSPPLTVMTRQQPQPRGERAPGAARPGSRRHAYRWLSILVVASVLAAGVIAAGVALGTEAAIAIGAVCAGTLSAVAAARSFHLPL
jgi:hypothetical protein